MYLTNCLPGPVGTTTDLTISIRQLEACESFIFDVGIVGPLGAGPMSGRMVNLRTQYSPFASPKNVKIVKDPLRPTFFKLLWSASCDTMDSQIGYRVCLEISFLELCIDDFAFVSDLL